MQAARAAPCALLRSGPLLLPSTVRVLLRPLGGVAGGAGWRCQARSPDHRQRRLLPGRHLSELVHTALQQRVGRAPELVLAPVLQQGGAGNAQWVGQFTACKPAPGAARSPAACPCACLQPSTAPGRPTGPATATLILARSQPPTVPVPNPPLARARAGRTCSSGSRCSWPARTPAWWSPAPGCSAA